MRSGRPLTKLSITEDQRQKLENWARRPKTAQALALRARIILACAGGQANKVVARQSHVAADRVQVAGTVSE